MPDIPTSTAIPTSDLEELRDMIKSSTALNEAEKSYWLDLLPNMSDGQRQQLRNILQTEQKNLQKIDEKYDKKLEQVSQKYLQRWDSEKTKTARIKRVEEEQSHKQAEEVEAEALLKNW